MKFEDALNPPANEKLSHLGGKEISELIQFYYANEDIDELLKIYKIDTNKNNLFNLFPPEVLVDQKCRFCNLPMWIKRLSRSNTSISIPYCPNCLHQEIPNCNCSNCKIIADKNTLINNDIKRKNLIKTINLNLYTPSDYTQTPDLYKIYLGALMRVGLSENLEYIVPIDSFSEKFTPSVNFDEEIIDDLYHSNIIEISPYSNHDCFSDVTDNGNFRYYPRKVCWYINLFYDCSKKHFVSKMINYEEPIKDKKLLLGLWKKMALLECLEYLDYQLRIVDLHYDTGEKTNIVIDELLNNFSTGQIYGIIWSSVTNAVRFFQEKHPPGKNAAKAVITNCQRHGEKALLEKWNVKTFSRIKELPQSSFSKFLFNRILKLGDDGFYFKPEIDFIKIDE